MNHWTWMRSLDKSMRNKIAERFTLLKILKRWWIGLKLKKKKSYLLDKKFRLSSRSLQMERKSKIDAFFIAEDLHWWIYSYLKSNELPVVNPSFASLYDDNTSSHEIYSCPKNDSFFFLNRRVNWWLKKTNWIWPRFEA